MNNQIKTDFMDSKFMNYAREIKEIYLENQTEDFEEWNLEELLDFGDCLFREYEKLYFMSQDYKKITGKVNNFWKKYEAYQDLVCERVHDAAYNIAVRQGDPNAYMLSKEYVDDIWKIIEPELKGRGFFKNPNDLEGE